MDEHSGSDCAFPALLLENVVKSYGSLRALNRLSLRVLPGEFVALLGPNGAGKTTLFQLLSGLFSPDAGRIEIMGHSIADDAVSALAHVGIVFQLPTLDNELSVMANMMFHAGLHGLPRPTARNRIMTELARFGLSERADQKVSQLSGGYRRRVELARATLHDPRVLLMDEPTVGLDPATRRELLNFMLAMRSRSSAILWATHLCDEVSEADRVVVVHRGEVLADSPPADLMSLTRATSIEQAFLSLTKG
jgi:ABC-2 type transport system ATP-binding protein